MFFGAFDGEIILLEIAVPNGSLRAILIVPVHLRNKVHVCTHDLGVGVALEYLQCAIFSTHHDGVANLIGDGRQRHNKGEGDVADDLQA